MLLIIWIILIVCFIILLYIVLGKFPKLTIIRPESSQQVRQEKIKKSLYEQRLKRQGMELTKQARRWFGPWLGKFSDLVVKFYNSLKKKEEEYRHRLLHQDIRSHVDKESRVSTLLTEAIEMQSSGDEELAEQKYIDILKIDPHNTDAYSRLAKIYRKRKEYDNAIEIYNYLLKLSKDPEVYQQLANIAEERGDLQEAERNYLSAWQLNDQEVDYCYNLAKLYQQLGDNIKSQEMIRQALNRQPNNPKLLDFMVQISIMNRDKTEADEAWQVLQSVNGENQKLSEYRQAIDELS
ncbi:MAG: hypothetical protein NUV82_04425 [Candidatus Komeilibacteria bacterium]|nr:hypothetical protein [Candidatus Komeilibacteria bacterium]